MIQVFKFFLYTRVLSLATRSHCKQPNPFRNCYLCSAISLHNTRQISVGELILEMGEGTASFTSMWTDLAYQAVTQTGITGVHY